jgi:unsaturated rhamnogalacturonyl hydrolase
VDAVATTWSQRTAEALMKRQPILSDRWDYKWGVVLKGVEAVWRATGDVRYSDYVTRNVDHFIDPTGEIATYRMADHNIDHLNPGKVLFALRARSDDERYGRAADLLREQLRTQPRTPSGGFWHKRVYPDQMWLDGIYMGCPFYAEHAAGSGDAAAFDDIVHQITLIFEHTRDPKTRLLYHGWDESRAQAWADPRTGCSPGFWARAIGWYTMALVDVLDILPDARQRATVAAILQETMAGVARVQDETGLWYQVIDQGDRAGNYLESSASSMFAYAFAKGARQGHLPPDRRRLAARAYEAIVARFVRQAPDGDVTFEGTCRGAGLGPAPAGQPYRDGSFEYYVSQPVATNDHHGVGAFLLASVELERAAG